MLGADGSVENKPDITQPASTLRAGGMSRLHSPRASFRPSHLPLQGHCLLCICPSKTESTLKAETGSNSALCPQH